MNYIGIDISLTHTAMICLNAEGEIVSLIEKLGYFLPEEPPPTPWDLTERADMISSGIYHFLLQSSVKYIGIEGYSFASGGAYTLQIAELIGVVRHKIASIQKLLMHMPIFIPPTSLKKFATGKGNVDKTPMAIAASKQPWNFEHPDDNVIDAYWLAQMMRYVDKSIRPMLPILMEPKVDALKKLGLW